MESNHKNGKNYALRKWFVAAFFLLISGAAIYTINHLGSEDRVSGYTELKLFQEASRTTIHIKCQKQKAIPVAAGASIGEIQSRACKALLSDSPPWGDHTCAKGSKGPIATLRGVYMGKKVSGKYQAGPCSDAMQTWVKLSQLWSPGAPNPMQTRLFILTPSSDPPASLLRKLKNIRKNSASVQGLPCLRSLSVAPTRSCWIQASERTPYMAVQLNWEQIEQLIGASPEGVRSVLLSATRIPMPRGFPGYKTWENVSPRLPI